MHVQELKLSKRQTELLMSAGLDSVEKVQQAGRDGLIAIDGIGPASADEILTAAMQAGAPPPPPKAEPPPNPHERVSVRNASGAPVVLDGKYLFPGDVRVIRRHQVKAGLVVQGAGA